MVVLCSSSSVSGVLGAGREGRGSRRSGAEEVWRFQAEFLWAECHFLRMEREVALKKLERNRVQMEKEMTHSAVHLNLYHPVHFNPSLFTRRASSPSSSSPSPSLLIL